MYADDVKIYLLFNNIEDQVLIQDDINYLTSWFSTNLIKLNVKKFNYVGTSLYHLQPKDFIQ